MQMHSRAYALLEKKINIFLKKLIQSINNLVFPRARPLKYRGPLLVKLSIKGA